MKQHHHQHTHDLKLPPEKHDQPDTPCSPPLTIALFKTNHIGDVILAAPTAEQIKHHFPNCHLVFVATQPACQLVQTLAAVDTVVDWTQLAQLNAAERIAQLKAYQIDIAIQLNPDKAIARDLKQAGIMKRISSRWRLYNWRYCNRLVALPRHKSLHKSQSDYYHLKALGLSGTLSTAELIALQRLTPLDTHTITNLQPYLSQQHFNLILHPKSITARRFEWPLQHYMALVQQLPHDRFRLLIGGTRADGEAIRPLLDACPEAIDLTGQLSLLDYFNLIRLSDGLVGGSTGPLHLAAIAGIHCLGIYRAEAKTVARWHPLGPKAQWIHDSKPCTHPNNATPCSCIQRITPKQVLDIIENWPSHH